MRKTAKCPCRGDTLDRMIQPATLAYLSREDLSGYRLVQRLGKLPMFHGQQPDRAGLYRCLHLLAARGMVKGAWRLSRRGPAQRVFAITPAGRECLGRWTVTLREYRRNIASLLALSLRRGHRPRTRNAPSARSRGS